MKRSEGRAALLLLVLAPLPLLGACAWIGLTWGALNYPVTKTGETANVVSDGAYAYATRGAAGLEILSLRGAPMRRYQELPRDREIITQCKMGGRSAKAQDFLKSVGFGNVKNLKGGILEWIDKVDPSQPKY